VPELTKFYIHTHQLDDAQLALLSRTVEHCHDAQKTIAFIRGEEQRLPVHSGAVSWPHLIRESNLEIPQIIVTGLRLTDSWFSHTLHNYTLITAADWGFAFRDWQGSPPAAAPDAYLLQEFTNAALLASIGLPEESVSHFQTTGCIADMCVHKPDAAIKLRSGFLCSECRKIASEAGLSGVYLDAIQALLDRARLLALGRSPQGAPPDANGVIDESSLDGASLPEGCSVPPLLFAALRARQLTVLVGSGLSLQADVRVQYEQHEWNALPTWSEIAGRLSQRLHIYRGQLDTPRQTETLAEFLTDLDFFRERLGVDLFYPRALFDIFLPKIVSTGLSNRLVFRLPLRWLLTTNYDFILNYAAPAGTPSFTWREARQASEYIRRASGRPPILKLHGCASRANTVVLTGREYDALGRDNEYRALTHHVFAEQDVLFIGYGLNDPFDLDMAISAASLGGAAQGEKFALIYRPRAQALRAKFPNVQMITYEAHEDVPKILAVLGREAP
jgi:hypothetical protein